MEKTLPLKELTIAELFVSRDKETYEIPIYQRNYAWEKDEISALIQDVYDSFQKDINANYYIGTLVTYHKGDNVYEVIDGQQRLTTIWLILAALGEVPVNRLTYRARKKSDAALNAIKQKVLTEKSDDAAHLIAASTIVDEETDRGIENGFDYVKDAIADIGFEESEKEAFLSFFKEHVCIIHYQVPKDVDLNHYFEIMNSRGEQLEKHEIVKATLMQQIKKEGESEKETDRIRDIFDWIWTCCSEMSSYAQQNFNNNNIAEAVFGNKLEEFKPTDFNSLADILLTVTNKKKENEQKSISIEGILNLKNPETQQLQSNDEKKDTFLPIIDFPNFLLIVLKITKMNAKDFDSAQFSFTLDDKELLNEFTKEKLTADQVREFAYNLLKAKFYLDNYIVHHDKEEDTLESNPWKLQIWHKESKKKKWARDLASTGGQRNPLQNKLVHLLSMFEVSFTARQRKNYLFYCLLYLLRCENVDLTAYATFVEELADRYFQEVYLVKNKLNAINTPNPGSFDETILQGNKFRITPIQYKDASVFVDVYGNGTKVSNGIPLFVFNYLDYKLWALYDKVLRGKNYKKGDKERQEFFAKLGCEDFGQDIFDQFYFSRTRRSLEHYYAQANATGENGSLNEKEINCFGNYAMIGSEANSSGSNLSPVDKLDKYLNRKDEITQISVASLKFRIMMKICRKENRWMFEEIQEHQNKMVALLVEG